jgi:hypothetical protein
VFDIVTVVRFFGNLLFDRDGKSENWPPNWQGNIPVGVSGPFDGKTDVPVQIGS